MHYLLHLQMLMLPEGVCYLKVLLTKLASYCVHKLCGDKYCSCDTSCLQCSSAPEGHTPSCTVHMYWALR